MIRHGTEPAWLEPYRHRRYLTMREVPAAPPGQCRWCGGPKPARRRSWCSDACHDEFLIRWCGGEVIRQVYRRDKGICAVCGIDAEVILDLRRRVARLDTFSNPHVTREAWGPWARREQMWEADHILPVSEGGGCCGLGNYRTLCVVCHNRESGLLRRRLNRRGKPEQMDLTMVQQATIGQGEVHAHPRPYP